jgi:hypothetical protein
MAQSRQSARHRVGRVLSFFSSRRNWDSPQPPTRSLVCPLPLVSGGQWGEGNTRWRERGWESPNSDEGHTLWYSLYVRTLWCKAFSQLSELGPPHPAPLHPSAADECFPLGGTHSPSGEGVGVPVRTRGQTLLYSMYCIYEYVLCGTWNGHRLDIYRRTEMEILSRRRDAK